MCRARGKSHACWDNNHIIVLPCLTVNILAKFDEENMIFDEIKGHLQILLFYRARASQGLLLQTAIKFEVKMLDMPNVHI